MVRNLLVFLVLMGFVFSILPPVVETVDYCQVINAPGEYTLTSDLAGVNGTNTYCMRIGVGDVVLDCDGYRIMGAGTGEGVNIKTGAQHNVTVKNCNISKYDYGIFGDPYNGSILNNDLTKNNLDNMNIGGSYNLIEGNLFHYSLTREGAHVGGNHNIFTGNEFYDNGRKGLQVIGYWNQVEDNTAYNNGESGFSVDGEANEFIGNTAYNNDWDYFEGAGFEAAGVNTFDDNTAYGNTNGFYIEGYLPEPVARRIIVFGNTFTNNRAYNNLVGLNFIDNNGTYTDNTLEENYEADLLIGGDMWIGSVPLTSDAIRSPSRTDWTVICDNTVENNTGSGARPIYYSGETVTLSGGTYSEVLLCNATDSVLTGVTVDGSNTLDNNGMILLFSNGTTITDSTSQNNFMGFGFVLTPDATLSNSNSDGSGFGVFSLRSMNLNIDRLTSNNNRMNSTIILEILMGFFGGPLTGETMRAPPPEINELGAGAMLIQSPRATITDSTFSGSTFGLALFMSDEATINGGSAHHNDVFGYGLLDSYNVNFYGSQARENAGDIHDIFVDRIPEQYEMLEFLPFGVGITDISLDMIRPPVPPPSSRGEPLRAVSTCWSYVECGLGPVSSDVGGICNFTSQTCEAGTFENVFSGMRIYENHYGLVLFNLGHEVVDRCRVYDNHIFGLLDASDPVPFSPLTYVVIIPNVDSVPIQTSSFYRNGAQLFSVLSELYEEGGKPAWAEAFAFFDVVIPAGVLEMEIIEASYLHRMELPLGELEYAGEWKLEETTVGTGPSSVRMSLDDNATAIYLIHDTTLPTVNSIHMESVDFGVNMTLYLDIDDIILVEPRVSYNNKYFTVAAITEYRDLGAPVGPSIEKFVVHYGPTGAYDSETMGLYYLKIIEMGQYCEEDLDCDERTDVCSQNMCIEPECYVDEDCGPVARASPEYCVDYRCVFCRDNADCDGTCTKCNINGKCRAEPWCLGDIDCNEGCECTDAGPGSYDYCLETRVASAGGSCGGLAAPEEEVVLLRGVVEEQEVILKAFWVPVIDQINDVEEETITIYGFTQTDQTEFMEIILGSLPVASDAPEFSLYFDIYGLFAVKTPGVPDDGGKPDYVCEETVDCPECYYCSLANNACLPRTEGIECGVPGTGCPTGYECESCECVKEAPPEDECETDTDCAGNEYCDDGECVLVECECGEVKDHECIAHPCCSDEECGDLICVNNKCVEPEDDGECNECDEPIAQTEEILDKVGDEVDTSKVDDLIGKAKEAKDKGDCEEAVKYAEEALAAAQDLLGEDEPFSAPVISTEVPSVEDPQLPNGKEVTEWQQNIFWMILLILGLALVGYWYFRNHYGK